jgi:hypothetical protein
VSVSRGLAPKDILAILVHHKHQIRAAKLASVAQFGSNDFSLKYRYFTTRKLVPYLIREDFRSVKNMKEISHQSFASSNNALLCSDECLRIKRGLSDQCCGRSQSRAVSANLSNAVTLSFAATEVMT